MATSHALIQKAIAPHLVGSRTESAALLAWFLYSVWRLDLEDVADAICDGGGDKGIDALVVSDDSKEICIFQSKHHVSAAGAQGDNDMKKLFGAAKYFESGESVDGLMNSKPRPELQQLVVRSNVRAKVEDDYQLRLVFVTDGTLDSAGKSYVSAIASSSPDFEVWDLPRLAAIAKRVEAPAFKPGRCRIQAASKPSSIDMSGGTKLVVGLFPASELVKLPGISDLSIFDRNVRLSEGRTRINKELAATIRDAHEHQLFPAYHNGLTLLTRGLRARGRTLELDGVTVVNGCQSLLALYEQVAFISPDLRVLVKVVEVPSSEDIVEKITYRTNNQNPVDLRDQRSTDAIQRGLQREVEDTFGKSFAYIVRQGESTAAARQLDNQLAAQLLTAAYLREPWAAVRKVRLFDQDYRRIFDKNVTAERLFLLRLIADVLDVVKVKLRPDLAASFASVRFTIVYLLARALDETDDGKQLLANPARWLPAHEVVVVKKLAVLAEELIESVNFFIQEEETEAKERNTSFDPKTAFKSRKEIERLQDAASRDLRRVAKKDTSFMFDMS